MSLPCRAASLRRQHPVAWLLLAVSIAGTLLAVMPAAARSAPQGAGGLPRITFGVQPATRAGLDSTRPDFNYVATPGGTVNDYVAIRNYANEPVSLQTYAGDAFNGPTGAYDILRRFQRSKDLGAWITLGRKAIKIPGRAFVILPFRLQLPKDAEPGDHDAGIVAAIITQRLQSNGTTVAVEERVGARVHMRVTGPLRPQLTVRQLKTVYNDSWNPFGAGSATIKYTVANTGNIRLSAAQTLQVKSLIGGTRPGLVIPRIPELLPGNSFDQSVKVTGVWPGVRVKTTVILDPASPKTFPVQGLKQVRKSVSTWAFPWMLIALALVLAFAIWAARWWRRRQAESKGESKPAVKDRQLVAAGVGASDSSPGSDPPDGAPIDLRDPQPAEVDLLKSELDLRERPAAKPGPELENPPPDTPKRK